MISPHDVAGRAQRAYPAFLRNWLKGIPFTALSLPVGTPSPDYRTLQREVETLLQGAKEQRGYGYEVELQTLTTRMYGVQSLPKRVHITTAEDLLRLAGKVKEFAAIRTDVALIRSELPELESWLEPNIQHVINHHGEWSELLKVCAYFLSHPKPGLYARELPIMVHTKFVEEHTRILRSLLDALLPLEAINTGETQFEQPFGLRVEEPQVRIRLLDYTLTQRLGLPLLDVSAPVSALATLDAGGLQCIIVENKKVFLTLPALPNTLAIFGSGFSAAGLANLSWLHNCASCYWGDLDAQGFQILAHLRAHFPQVRSLMMDQLTFTTFRTFVVGGTPCINTELANLTPEEHVLFAQLASSNTRLEQERISYNYAQEQLKQALSIL